ncbi:hypothetical protein Q1695_004803 [Nippostrongylus brasiliensis]|nr:hypothetical protein Q1695_004803 [Nippostrongylus brasiliensis]
MEGIGVVLHDRVHNKKWFTARGLESLSKSTGQDVTFLSRAIIILVFILLLTSSNWIICNTILVVVPLLLTYTYPNEKPSQEGMAVYWVSAFVMTAFDRMLEEFPFYYFIKLCILLSLLVEPSSLSDGLKKLLKLSVSLSLSGGLKKLLKLSDKRINDAAHATEQPKSPELSSAWGRFTESIRSAISGQPSVSQPPPRQQAVPAPSTCSEITPAERKSDASGVPTPYDAKPVGVDQTLSTYVNLPKPTGRNAQMSMRLAPDLQANPTGSRQSTKSRSPSVGQRKRRSKP